MLLSAERLVLPGADQPVPGWVEIDGDHIVAVGAGAPPRPGAEELSGLVAPGLVDVHSHGGGGASFITTDARQVEQVLRTHRAHGTTTMVASLVTASIDDLEAQVRVLAPFVAEGELAGIHLEGPWLAEGRKGAHEAALLRDPTAADIDRLLAAAGGAIRLVTIAPERVGASAAIAQLSRAGVVVAVGHTEADLATTVEAIDAGARGATHLFNAMPSLGHRDPGPVLGLLRDPRVFLELIFDGVHVDAELAAFVLTGWPGRVALITDAMAAAASADGDYLLGGLPVEVRDGVARVAGTQTIAGSTLTLDRAVRTAVASGVPLMAALRAATEIPAAYLGLSEVGCLAAGRRADLVVFDDELYPVSVMRSGRWSEPAM